MHHNASYIHKRMTLRMTAAALIGLALLPAASAARTADQRALWATVNVCDTLRHPDTIGVRGSMPGSGDRHEHMFMRFQVQYLSRKDSSWHNIGPTGDTGFVAVGPGKYRARQAGRYFTIRPPATGAFTLRGVVTYEWRVNGEVARRARKHTTAGHGNTSGADPRGFSAATCDIKK